MPQGQIAAPRGFGYFCQDKSGSPQQAAKPMLRLAPAMPENTPLTSSGESNATNAAGITSKHATHTKHPQKSPTSKNQQGFLVNARDDQPPSNSSTAARSLRNSSSVAFIRACENSLTSRP